MSVILRVEAINEPHLSFSSTVPPSLQNTLYPSAETAYASGKWGHILLQEATVNGFIIGRYSFYILTTCQLRISLDTSLATLHFTMTGKKEKIDLPLLFPLPEHNYGLLNTDQHQMFTLSLRSGSYLFYHIFFSKSLLEKFRYHQSVSLIAQHPLGSYYLTSLQMDRRTYKLVQLLDDQLLQSPPDVYFLNAKCLYIILKFITDLGKSEQYKAWLSKKENQVIDVTREIEILFNLGQLHDLTISDLAKKLSLSVYQLKKITRELYHLTPMGLIQKVRMEKALQLLKEKKLSINKIAQQLGYTDQSSFTRAFKAWYSHPPSSIVKE